MQVRPVQADPPQIGKQSKGASINQTMAQIGTTLMDLYPYILDQDSDHMLENRGLIATQVNRLIFLLKSAQPHFLHRSKTFQVSYDVLIGHLSETQKAIARDNMRYAYSLLNEVSSICSSCHTQDQRQRTLFKDGKRARFNSDFQFAEFNFLTRNYPVAVRYYEKTLQNQSKDQRKNMMALDRVLTIYVQVQNQPGTAARFFEKYKDTDNVDALTKRSMQQWIPALRQLDKNKTGANPNFTQLEQEVHEYLGSLQEAGATLAPTKTQKVFHLWLQGRLYRYLSTATATEVPKLLYWLALNARATKHSYYFSLADLYLKQCMLEYSRHDYARKCFEEYKESVEFSYSGSIGTHIPQEVQQELNRLKAIVHSK
ncbi:MAG: hypothetical protein OEZ68_19340 [Gammaproteobacteria bacterium]|nr:hypothetical protein [Gammaproteobacteria bacterium]MDH5802964.1 hypothetical protein [Gammaproteobacteria bacterium]